MQTILGANGTIGSVLAKELTAYTDKIRLVGRNPKKINPGDELFPADLSDPAQVNKAVEGSDVVYLLVGFEYNLKVWRQKWPVLMRAVLDACIKHQAKLVFFDNVYLYSPYSTGFMTENSEQSPPSKKGLVRKQVFDMMIKEIKNAKLNGIVVRAADFYGPYNEKSFLIETVYKNLKKGKKANWFMSANKRHSFTYTPDAAKATALLANTPDAYNQVWHLPTDKNSLTGKEFVYLFAEAMETDDKYTVLPMWMLKLIGLFVPFMRELPEMMYQYDRDYVFNSDKFNNRFPDFKTTRYADGVKETVSLMKSVN
jgi:nucleoside-diphosphate-sugar epimerase